MLLGYVSDERFVALPDVLLELESEAVRPPQSVGIPSTWRWTRLLDIGEINPRNEAPDDLLVAFVPIVIPPST